MQHQTVVGTTGILCGTCLCGAWLAPAVVVGIRVALVQCRTQVVLWPLHLRCPHTHTLDSVQRSRRRNEAVVYTERRGQLLRHTDGQMIAAMSAHNLYSGRQPAWGQSYRYLRHRQLHHVEQRRVPGHMGAKRQRCHCMEQRTANSEQRRSTAQHSREVERTEQR